MPAQHALGLKKDTPDERDFRFNQVSRMLLARVGVKARPVLGDLRPCCSAVRDQGNIGSCVGESVVASREYLEISTFSKPYAPLSPLYAYYQGRVLEGTVNEDSGLSIRTGMQVLTSGVCPEKDWPYNTAKFTSLPPDVAFSDSAKFVTTSYYRVSTLNELLDAIGAGHLPVIGIEVYESFESDPVVATGIVPMPDKQREELLGGHAILAVAYNDAPDSQHGIPSRYVGCKNSWGTGFGDGGYIYLPYSYFDSAEGLVLDMWVAVL